MNDEPHRSRDHNINLISITYRSMTLKSNN